MQDRHAPSSNSAFADKPNRRWPALATPARQAMAIICAKGVELYQREAMLQRLLPGSTEELALPEPERTAAIISALHRLLRAERARCGHWTYDLNRHIALSQALQGELARQQKTPPL